MGSAKNTLSCSARSSPQHPGSPSSPAPSIRGPTFGGSSRRPAGRSAGDFDDVLARVKKDGAAGIIATSDALTFLHRQTLAQIALKHRLPGIYWSRDYVDVGGLMTYSANINDLRRRAATYVDRILRGASPADLPVERPTRFELIINAKTAKALGLTIPQSVLLRADQVIE